MIGMQQFVSKTFKFHILGSSNEIKCRVKMEVYCPEITKQSVDVLANELKKFMEEHQDARDLIHLSELVKVKLKNIIPINVIEVSLVETNGYGIEFVV